ncbi:MAG TPA: hypothetical protein VFH39_03185 [Candidatus Saccharimonadales bacterium]|nr:hypothetical protein [Candidatus Saccharimonadales bacterium]
MSRYLILMLLNLPLILAGLLGSLIDLKTGKISRGKYAFQSILWLIIFAGLASAEIIYDYLHSHHLTRTPTMSLFDVIEITGIIYILFMANRSRIKADVMERRLQDLHQELSIKLSEKADK